MVAVEKGEGVREEGGGNMRVVWSGDESQLTVDGGRLSSLSSKGGYFKMSGQSVYQILSLGFDQDLIPFKTFQDLHSISGTP